MLANWKNILYNSSCICDCGEIGRRAVLRSLWEYPLEVQVFSIAPFFLFPFLFIIIFLLFVGTLGKYFIDELEISF